MFRHPPTCGCVSTRVALWLLLPQRDPSTVHLPLVIHQDNSENRTTVCDVSPSYKMLLDEDPATVCFGIWFSPD
jgi:hypothetical protein